MENDVPPPLPSTPEFKDRKTGLVIFGIFTLLGGVLFALFTLFMVKSLSAQTNPDPATNLHALLPAICIWGTLAVTLIWLGIGSMMARRWARALLLICSWATLITGVLGVGTFAIVMPKFMATMQASQTAGQPGLPQSAQMGIMIFTGVVMGLFLVILPGIWVWFYGSKNTKATCEARDPVERWTDRCPLPVLALSLMLIFGGVCMFLNPMAWHGVLPCFGMLLSGPLGMAAWAIIAAIWLYSGWAVYHLDIRGWWLALVMQALFAISGFITYSRHSMAEMYQLMGYNQKMIEQMQQNSFLQGNTMAWLTLLSALPWLVYLLFVKKFFRRTE